MNAQRMFFRTDASIDIGTGHVMRCLTLADALRELGSICCFICREHKGNLIHLIRSRGYEVIALPAETNCVPVSSTELNDPLHAPWLGAHWTVDAYQTANALADCSVGWLIVDHYALDARWETNMRQYCDRLMIIDDLADRPHNCDFLLDHNLGRNAIDYTQHVPAHCTLLIGPQFALLRPEFSRLRPHSLARRKSPQFKQLLITMGGVDKNNVTGQVLNALKCCTLPLEFQITVLMGKHAPWLNEVHNLATTLPWKTDVLINTNDVAQLMVISDLAIGAAGSTTWERCALGLPTLQCVLAYNQKKVSKELAAKDAVILLATGNDLDNNLQEHIEYITRDLSHLYRLSQRAAMICDGQGTQTVINHLLHQ